MNRRKLTKFLDHRAVRSLDAARYHAETLGHLLNCFVTIAPCRGLVVHSKASADYFASIRNWVGIWIRRRKIRFTAIWTIENNSGGTDPHMHILMHVTAQLISDFRTALARQYPGDSVGLSWPSGLINFGRALQPKRLNSIPDETRFDRIGSKCIV